MKKLCVGRILGAHGVRGDVLVQSYTDPAKNLLDYAPYYARDADEPFALSHKGSTAKGFIFTTPLAADRDAAAALRGTELWVPRSVLHPMDAQDQDQDTDSFYYSDLEGLELRTPQGDVVGTCVAVHDHGAGVYLEGVTPDNKAFTVPFTPITPLACLGHRLKEKRTQCLVIIRLTSPSSSWLS